MFPLMGYFLHVSLAPQVLMGRRAQREDESLALTFRGALVWRVGVRGRVCVHVSARTQLGECIRVRFCTKAGKVRPIQIQRDEAPNLFLVCLSWK